MTNVYLIRHGEAVCNVQPIIAGMKGDTGLTERGVAQAESLRDRLVATREIVPDVFISSTLPRAKQTAEIISPAFNTPIIWDDDMREINVGDSDGMTLAEAAKTFGLDFEKGIFHPIAQGGESWGQFMLRVGAGLERIIHEHAGKTIVIVCHGGVIDNSFAYFFSIHTRVPSRLEFYPDNTSITHWQQYIHQYHNQYWRLVKYNDIAHLHTVGAQESPRWSQADSSKTD
jgi:probable phosphoglycerate mutase